MWMGIDPLWEKYAGMNPYNYCAGNPVRLVDPNGMFILKAYSDEELGDMGLTREEYTKFNTLTDNMINMLDNESVNGLEGITGREGKVKDDFKPGGTSPLIEITPGTDASADHYGNIRIGADLISDWVNSNDSERKYNKEYTYFDEKTFMMALLIIHEYAHWGDRRSNDGWITGQFPAGQVVQGLDGIDGFSLFGYAYDNERTGIQGISLSGHRGTDATTLFGGRDKSGKNYKLDITVNNNKIIWINCPLNSNPWLKADPKTGKTKIRGTLGF